jgi:hypothetical protein
MIFSTVLSALRIALAQPDTFITTVPFTTFDPSLTRISLLQPQISKSREASSRPQTTAKRDLHTISAFAARSAGIMLSLVMSPAPTSSCKKLASISRTLRNAFRFSI